MGFALFFFTTVRNFYPALLRRRLHLLVAALLWLDPLLSVGQTAGPWRWATVLNGISAPETMTTDSAGNQYVAGRFRGTVAFGTQTLTSIGGRTNCFIGKLDSLGQWQWASPIAAGDTLVRLFTIKLDARRGELLVVGNNASALRTIRRFPPPAIDPGFLMKIDAITGNLIWTRFLPGVTDVAADSNGHLYVCGAYERQIIIDSLTLTATYYQRGQTPYLARLDSAGQCRWLIPAGIGDYSYAHSIYVAADGAIYIGGAYDDTANSFGMQFGTFYTERGGGSGFEPVGYIAKLSASRTWEWAYTTLPFYGTTNAWRTDGAGNLYLPFTSVIYEDITIFNNQSSQTIAGPPVVDIGSGKTKSGVFSLTPQGILRWAAFITNDAAVTRLSVNSRGEATVLGYTFSSWPGDTTTIGQWQNISPPGSFTNFIAALDRDGRWQWADTLSGDPFWAGYSGAWDMSSDPRRRHFTYAAATKRTTLTLAPFSITNPNAPRERLFIAQRGLPGLINAFSPAAGPAGTVLTLSGTGFIGTTQVLIGGIPAAFTVLSNGQIQVTVPPGLPTGGAGVYVQLVGPNGTTYSGATFLPRPLGTAAEAAGAAFQLWPNPAHQSVRLRGLPAGTATVQLLDGTGRVVRTAPATAETLDLRGLAPGVYTVRAGAAARRLAVE
jgi:hypothetical protein